MPIADRCAVDGRVSKITLGRQPSAGSAQPLVADDQAQQQVGLAATAETMMRVSRVARGPVTVTAQCVR
jgi:hypothetical protein